MTHGVVRCGGVLSRHGRCEGLVVGVSRHASASLSKHASSHGTRRACACVHVHAITCPSDARLLLIETPSSSPSPSRPVSFGRSEPARSTKLSFERNALRRSTIGTPAEGEGE